MGNALDSIHDFSDSIFEVRNFTFRVYLHGLNIVRIRDQVLNLGVGKYLCVGHAVRCRGHRGPILLLVIGEAIVQFICIPELAWDNLDAHDCQQGHENHNTTNVRPDIHKLVVASKKTLAQIFTLVMIDSIAP